MSLQHATGKLSSVIIKLKNQIVNKKRGEFFCSYRLVGLGYRPFEAKTRVQVSLRVPISQSAGELGKPIGCKYAGVHSSPIALPYTRFFFSSSPFKKIPCNALYNPLRCNKLCRNTHNFYFCHRYYFLDN